MKLPFPAPLFSLHSPLRGTVHAEEQVITIGHSGLSGPNAFW